MEEDHGCGCGDTGKSEVFGCLFDEAACFSPKGSFFCWFEEAGFAGGELAFGEVDGC